MKRESGVLLHISSLPGDYHCGSFGQAAKDFVNLIADAGFTYWQVLPFGMPDEHGSPYKSISAFAGNPYFIDLDALYGEGLLTLDELEAQRQTMPYLCDFEALAERFTLFLAVSKRVKNREAVEAFIEKNPRLDEFCRFMALKEANGGAPWWEFDPDKTSDDDILFMHRFLQYKFFEQWSEIKAYANARGVKLIGDMPIYVDLDSSDVYFGRENFLLDADGKPSLVAGVPPDYFSPDGQLWGNPIYDWAYMKKDGYTWWRARMAHTMKVFDGVRIDHFRAFADYYTVKATDENAKNGKWNKGPGLPFVKILKEVADGGMIIAEDLGDIDDKVKKLVKDSTFPGMRVFQFAFDGEDDLHRPHAYPENCVAYSGTHDNNTLLGYLWEMDMAKKREMLEYIGADPNNWEGAVLPIIKAIMRSHAAITIFPMQDLLGYGKDTRMNTPGKASGNWAIRLTKAQLDSLDTKYFCHLNELYNRKG